MINKLGGGNSKIFTPNNWWFVDVLLFFLFQGAFFRFRVNFRGSIFNPETLGKMKPIWRTRIFFRWVGESTTNQVVSAAKESSEPPTLVCRNWHWPVPRLLLNLVPFKYGTYSRFGHWMLHPYYGEGSVAQWFHGTCAPVKWIWWRVVELMFRGQFHIKSALGLIVK